MHSECCMVWCEKFHLLYEYGDDLLPSCAYHEDLEWSHRDRPESWSVRIGLHESNFMKWLKSWNLRALRETFWMSFKVILWSVDAGNEIWREREVLKKKKCKMWGRNSFWMQLRQLGTYDDSVNRFQDNSPHELLSLEHKNVAFGSQEPLKSAAFNCSMEEVSNQNTELCLLFSAKLEPRRNCYQAPLEKAWLWSLLDDGLTRLEGSWLWESFLLEDIPRFGSRGWRSFRCFIIRYR